MNPEAVPKALWSHVRTFDNRCLAHGTGPVVLDWTSTLAHHGLYKLPSLIYPLPFQDLRFGVQMGSVRMNASRPLFDLVGGGPIATDSSETEVALTYDGVRQRFSVSPRVPIADDAFVYDDYRLRPTENGQRKGA